MRDQAQVDGFLEEHINRINKFSSDSTKEIESMKGSLQEYANKLRDIFEENIYKDYKCIVQTRVKSSMSLKEKIYRKNYFNKYSDKSSQEFILNLPDLIGVRVICFLNSEEEEYYNKLKSSFKKVDEKNWEKKLEDDECLSLQLHNQPEFQKNGHTIYRISGKWTVRGMSYPLELQIKSMVHSFWGEMEHSMFYKNYQCVISDRLFSSEMNNIATHLELIDRELGELQDHYNRNEEERIKEIKEMTMLIIEKKFKRIFETLYGCGIDLREVYQLIVDIFFTSARTLKQSIDKMNEIINKINTIEEEDIKVVQSHITKKVNKVKFTDNYFEFGERIHNCVVGNGDVYWISFYSLFSVLFTENYNSSYEENLGCIVSNLYNLDIIKLFKESISINTEKDKKFLIEIHNAIFSEFNEKISFFTDRVRMKIIQMEIINFMSNTFEKYLQLDDESDIEKTLKEIYWIVRCLVEKEFNRKIDFKNISRLYDLCDVINEIDIHINQDYYEELKSKNTIYLETDYNRNNFNDKYNKLFGMEE